jgi:alpha-beta hydrolase superfamily lysophospholipase
MMYHSEGIFKGTKGLSLYYQSWHPPEPNPNALVAIVHGLGGHSRWFAGVAQFLTERHYAVYSFDLRGHGRSSGRRGHINSWSEFHEDLAAFVKLITSQNPKVPYFLLGHSMGAVIVLDYVLRSSREARDGLQGIILTAPALGKVAVAPRKLAIARFLSRRWPHFSLNAGFDAAASSRDPAVLAAYTQDPLRHQRGSARLAMEFFRTVAWVQAHAAQLPVPLLMLHGDADQIAFPEGGEQFFQQVALADKSRREYAGAYHDLHLDINRLEVLADLEAWLQQHLPTPEPPDDLESLLEFRS